MPLVMETMTGFTRRISLALAVFGLALPHAHAQILRLPESACAELPASGDGFESAPQSWASRGSGGAVGAGNAFISVPGFENQAGYSQREYFYFVPELPLSQVMPVVVALHGTAGSPTAARNEARIVRDLWIDAASRHGFAVVAPVGGSALGSWNSPDAPGQRPSDYDVIAAVVDQIEHRHNIERLRRYLWGFSAGGHVALDLMLNPWHDAFNRRQFAAVAINAGALIGLACAGIDAGACDQALHDAFPRLPLQVLAGASDPLAVRALQDAPRFRSQGWIDGETYRLQSFTGGHWVEPSHPQQQYQWLCRFSRSGDPIERFRLRSGTP